MMPKNNKHAPTKGQERPLQVTSIGKQIPSIARIPMAPSHGFLGTLENPNGLHAAKVNAGRIAVHDEDSKPDPVISTSKRNVMVVASDLDLTLF
jgi:hypothetical protein